MPELHIGTTPAGRLTHPKAQVAKGRYYPDMPPAIGEENYNRYSNRLLGVYGDDVMPYDHKRNRQCSLGWHEECSDPNGESCECPCHYWGCL